MRLTAVALAATLIGAFGSEALADRNRCPIVRAERWMPIEKVVERAESLGYAVRKTKKSKGCWEVEGYDRNGAEIEIRFDPVSGDVVRPTDAPPSARR